MRTLDLECLIPLDADTYFNMIYEEPFDSFQYYMLGMRQSVCLSYQQLSDGTIQRQIKVVPNVPLPGILLRHLNNHELCWFDSHIKSPAERTVYFRITPPVMADRLAAWGTVRIVPMDQYSCKQVLQVNFALDAIAPIRYPIESISIHQLSHAYSQLPEIVAAWTRECAVRGIDVRTKYKDLPSMLRASELQHGVSAMSVEKPRLQELKFYDPLHSAPPQQFNPLNSSYQC
eukprot:GEZU01011080.1.p1 GENE.GEZU01011080.1~~GEZU01011080.1.p1  ORF type:complete len:231 (+),score=18.05 GEZU01011080.1:29-721(+)